MDLDCPHIDIGACRCNKTGMYMTHSEDSAFYPKAGLLRLGRTLFKVRMCMHMGAHYWHWLVHKPPGVLAVVVFNNPSYQNYTIVMVLEADFHSFSGNSRSIMMNADTRINGISTSVLVWRIQRAMRRFLARRFEERCLAVLMVSHERLGASSPWGSMPTDVWREIAACVRPSSIN